MKLKRYQITYTDPNDAGCPDFDMVVKAYCKEHAEEKFYDGDEDDIDWKIISIELLNYHKKS